MNYFPLVKLKLEEFMDEVPGYTMGQILYSALILKYKNKEFTKVDLRELSDEEFYSLLSKALVHEQEEY